MWIHHVIFQYSTLQSLYTCSISNIKKIKSGVTIFIFALWSFAKMVFFHCWSFTKMVFFHYFINTGCHGDHFFLFFHMRKEMSNNGYTDWRSWLVVVDMVIYIYYTEHTCNFIFHVFPSSINIFNYSVFTKSSRNSKFCHCHWLKVQWENCPVWSCRYVIKIIVLIIHIILKLF